MTEAKLKVSTERRIIPFLVHIKTQEGGPGAKLGAGTGVSERHAVNCFRHIGKVWLLNEHGIAHNDQLTGVECDWQTYGKETGQKPFKISHGGHILGFQLDKDGYSARDKFFKTSDICKERGIESSRHLRFAPVGWMEYELWRGRHPKKIGKESRRKKPAARQPEQLNLIPSSRSGKNEQEVSKPGRIKLACDMTPQERAANDLLYKQDQDVTPPDSSFGC